MEVSSTEQHILEDLKKEQSLIKRFVTNSWTLTIFIILIIFALAGGFLYTRIFSNRISIDTAEIMAPSINLAPTTTGTLQALYVHEGDIVSANTPVARIGNEIIKTQVESQVINVQNNIGKIFNSGDTVVTVIEPSELRVVGTLEEDKGLKDIQVGQSAAFTVDTFGSKQFSGIVDEISPTAHAGDVVFNISDQRQISQYDVKIRFDIGSYPELKNGMSAKIVIYKK